jgi:glycine cleavage system aminomethyltransferase T
MDRLVDLDSDVPFIGKEALKRIKREGVTRKQVGLELDIQPLAGPNTSFWPVSRDGVVIGKVTSAVYSPRLEKNIALAMVGVEHTEIGTKVEAETELRTVEATVVEVPFFDPKKSIAKS